jgi:hypothetical protein
MPRSNKAWRYTSTSPVRLHGVKRKTQWQHYVLPFTFTFGIYGRFPEVLQAVLIVHLIVPGIPLSCIHAIPSQLVQSQDRNWSYSCYFSSVPHTSMNRNSWAVYRWATGWLIDGSSLGRGFEFFSLPPRPDRLWGPPSLLSTGYQGLFPWG